MNTHDRSQADIEAFCNSRTPEGLRLEFKRKEDASTPQLSKGDRKAIARSVSAMCNSEGGILIFGIGSTREGSADVASSLNPIIDIDIFKQEFDAVCALNISPQPTSIATRAIPQNDSNSGYLVCSVERSPRRPHMSTAQNEHRYYRRSFEGVVHMTPSEIRDQILAVRDAALVASHCITFPSNTPNGSGWVSSNCAVELQIRNEGVVTCRNPFMRLRTLGAKESAPSKWLPAYGTLIHPGDELGCSSAYLSVCVLASELATKFGEGSADLTSSVIVLPASEYPCVTVTDKKSISTMQLAVAYGSENAPLSEQNITITRKQFAQAALSDPTIVRLLVPLVGAFREDLVTMFLDSAP